MPAYQRTYNLLVVDDHQLMIDGLSGILKEEKLIASIYAAVNGQDAINLVIQHEIDCVLMDINMPKINGLDATKIIKQQRPDIKIIVISMLSDTPVVIKLLKAGADGFILKNTGREELVRAIEKVMNNEKYLSHELNLNLYNHLGHKKARASSDTHLTSREKEIIHYIADGMTNHDIADKLFLSTSTVDTHRKNILAKLELKNTAALVKYAAENNLL
jgi:two-component system, NarL family, nitrate/nitrite response regulator NarL